jgi:glycosyltransferase involved in cell wall biosynthesis
MIRVLQILSSLNVCGGVENFIMNYYRHIDKSRVQFDFLVHELQGDNFKKEAEGLGGRVYLLPKFTLKNLAGLLKQLESFYAFHKEYSIIHCHMANAAPFHFHYANKQQARIKILHSHQPSSADRFTHRMRNYLLLKAANSMADIRMAGSEDSGNFLFQGKKFLIIKNAVEANLFKNSFKHREAVRKRLNIEGKFVIGHVGRFVPVKNHRFLLEIIENIRKIRSDAVMVFIGEGETKAAVVKEIQKKGLEKNVIILDACRNIHEYYAAFDIFLLPSFFEGFGLVTVEAQYAGVPVIASESRVPAESKISSYMEFMPLEKGANEWVKKILSMDISQRPIKFFNDDYDICNQAKKLEKYYWELSAKNG